MERNDTVDYLVFNGLKLTKSGMHFCTYRANIEDIENVVQYVKVL